MPPNVSSTGVTITNPLVLYRALLATNRIKPDQAQYRLALHLQKLYERLIDYEPTIEYSQRLNQLSRAVGAPDASPIDDAKTGKPGLWTTLLREKAKRDSLSLTRVLTSHDAALELGSPQGLMLHGEVGTGKSMLIDLFADCLPSQKKRRWHFNTFMLETFAKLEHLRQERLAQSSSQQDDHSLLWLARDMIETSPILFLDEFQLPDRAASKIMSNLMTSFFQLGGVLIATSNRMPEELAKAAGVEFSRPPSRLESLGWKFGLRGAGNPNAQYGEFTAFLDVLKARCEIWEMNSGKDYRRIDAEESQETAHEIDFEAFIPVQSTLTEVSGVPEASTVSSQPASGSSAEPSPSTLPTYPKFFFIQPPPSPSTSNPPPWHQPLATSLNLTTPIPWNPSNLRVYGRTVPVARQHAGITHWTFAELCGTSLGPADYITLASTYHTLVLTSMPILTTLHKNEARRFITLLDALYEARCKLLLSAEAGPDELLFPETGLSTSTKTSSHPSSIPAQLNGADLDATHPETFSEAYQDATAPFRPNISSYSPSSSSASSRYSLPHDALEDDAPNRARQPNSSFTDERAFVPGPDFGQVAAFTGEDERFAYKRARSRIWEMTSARWWGRGEEGWWRPVPLDVRRWERDFGGKEGGRGRGRVIGVGGMSGVGGDVVTGGESQPDEDHFTHDASPFRRMEEPPPKISWTHVWGTVRWGKKAGAWGKGVDGLRGREKGDGGSSSGGESSKS